MSGFLTGSWLISIIELKFRLLKELHDYEINYLIIESESWF